jgi:hypothetical protein
VRGSFLMVDFRVYLRSLAIIVFGVAIFAFFAYGTDKMLE